MKTLDVIKCAGEFAVAVGVGTIGGCVMKATVPLASMNVARKVCVNVAGYVLSDMVSDKAMSHFDRKFDKVVEDVKSILNESEEQETEEGEDTYTRY